MKLPTSRKPLVHPVEILREGYLAQLTLSANALAVALSVFRPPASMKSSTDAAA